MVYIERVRSFTIPIRSIGYVKELTMNVVAKSARDHRARRAVKRFGYVARKSRQIQELRLQPRRFSDHRPVNQIRCRRTILRVDRQRRSDVVRGC